MYINPITLSNQSTPAEGLIELTAEQEKIYIEYSGFIKIISTDPVEIEPDIEAWEAWNKEHPDQPEQEPESVEYVTYGELAKAIREGVNSVE